MGKEGANLEKAWQRGGEGVRRRERAGGEERGRKGRGGKVKVEESG